MIRRSPGEYYTKFLILQPARYTDAQIKELLLDDQLDYVSGSYMKKLRAQCRPPEPFFPYDKNHRRSRNFLIGEGIEDRPGNLPVARLLAGDDAVQLGDVAHEGAHHLHEIPRRLGDSR